MNEASFTESKAAWTELFGNIFNVSADGIVLQYNNSSSEISVQVRSTDLKTRDEILNLMKNGSKFISSIKTEQDQVNELQKFNVTEVSPQPDSSK